MHTADPEGQDSWYIKIGQEDLAYLDRELTDIAVWVRSKRAFCADEDENLYIEAIREELGRLDKTLPDISAWVRSRQAFLLGEGEATSIWDSLECDKATRRRAGGKLIRREDVGDRPLSADEREHNCQIIENTLNQKQYGAWLAECADGRLYAAARAKYDATAGPENGLVTTKGEWPELSIGNSSYGDFWLVIEDTTHIVRYELGPDMHWHKSRQLLPAAPGVCAEGLMIERVYDDELDALAEHLAKLTFGRQ